MKEKSSGPQNSIRKNDAEFREINKLTKRETRKELQEYHTKLTRHITETCNSVRALRKKLMEKRH
jgi:hypothetical protein